MTDPLLYIVDNDLISLFDIRIRIHQSPYECRTQLFDDTETAFKMLAEDYKHSDGIPDIILVNFDLEGMDGLSFLKDFLGNGLLLERTHVYVFSSYKIPDHVTNMEVNKFVKGYFTKPLSNRDIDKIFGNYTEQNRGRHLRAM